MSRRRLPSLRLTAAKKGRGKDPTEEEEVAVEKEKEGEEREAEEEGGKAAWICRRASILRRFPDNEEEYRRGGANLKR